MKCSNELIYWMDSPDEEFARKKILSNDDWNERTVKDGEDFWVLAIKPEEIKVKT